MSIYSGKCDFADTVEMFGVDHILNNYKVYAADHIVPLAMTCEKDLVPYYPYIVTVMVSTKEEGGVIHLSPRSFVDEEEEEILNINLNRLLKKYNSCKRKHVPFNPDDYLTYWFSDANSKLLARVMEFGNKATIEGIHLSYAQHMRKDLYEEMLRVGYSEWEAEYWVYGRERGPEKDEEEINEEE